MSGDVKELRQGPPGTLRDDRDQQKPTQAREARCSPKELGSASGDDSDRLAHHRRRANIASAPGVLVVPAPGPTTASTRSTLARRRLPARTHHGAGRHDAGPLTRRRLYYPAPREYRHRRSAWARYAPSRRIAPSAGRGGWLAGATTGEVAGLGSS